MTGTSVQVIRWMVGQDQTTVWDVKKHTEKRSLSQNAYFHVLLGKIADAMRLPKPVVHNMMIRRYGQAQGIAGRLVTVAIPDTEKAEKETLLAETFHLRPTAQVRMGTKGQMFRTYVMMKGSHELDSREMAILLDGTIQEAEQLGIETLTPRERERLWKAS